MSLGCLNKKLEKLLNGKKFQNRILNAQRVRLQKFKKQSTKVNKKNEEQQLLKKGSTTVTQRNYPQTLLKKMTHNATLKMTNKRYSKK